MSMARSVTVRSQLHPPLHDHFSSIAERFAHFRPRHPEELFDYLATLVPKNSLVWDCACGNGQASLDLASRSHDDHRDFRVVLAFDP